MGATTMEHGATSGPARRQRGARIGAVSYFNTLPLIEGLGKLEDVSLSLTAPSQLIDLLLEDRIDVGLVSLIDAQRSPEPLALIPAGMIGCDGPTMTVRLFSRTPIEGLERVHVDADSHTSVALLRIVLGERFGLRPEIVEFDVEAHRASGSGAWPDAVLLIGDKVVTEAPPEDLRVHQLDLGEAWKDLTGLPFVYAVWMCRTDRVSDPIVQTAGAVLDRQRRHNTMRLDWIIATRAGPRGWPEDLARRYVVDLLRFDVSEAARRSVDQFFDLCLQHGVIRELQETIWV